MDEPRSLAVGAAAAVLGVAAGYGLERAIFRKRLPPTRRGPELGGIAGDMRRLDGPDGVRLNVETYGPAGAPQVVFVHGWWLSRRVWHEQVAALQDRYRLVTYDHPGHGLSSPPASGDYSIDLLGDALRTVIEEACDDAPILLVGHSMGGMTALAFARRHPEVLRSRVGALLLLSTTAHSGPEDVALSMGLKALLRLRAGIETAAGWLSPRMRYLARAYRASSDISHAIVRGVALVRTADPRYVDFTEQLVLDTDLSTVIRLSPVLLSLDEEETLAGIDLPTIIVCGTEDRMTPIELARWMADVNPDVDLLELPGIGHMTPLEAADTVNALIVRLVSTLDAGTVAAG